MKTKSTKRALVLSALSLLLCVSMLIGSTYAWFTDSVTSAGNIIKSGTLDVEMYWAKGTEAPESANWIDASTGAIFDYDLWEPGYVEVRHIKIENKGNLALKYQLSVVANGAVSELADVIDVYYVDPAVQVADRTALSAKNRLGTLTEVLANISTTASGSLEPKQNHTVTLALKMQEEAGNTYQNKSIGTSFSVKLAATQKDFEHDSFGKDYDEGLEPAAIYVSDPAGLKDAMLERGGYIKLQDDIVVDASTPLQWSKYMFVANGREVTIDLNGNDIIVADDAKLKTNAVFTTANKGTLNIVGEGTVEIKNGKSGIFHAMNGGDQINVYGGTYISDSDNGPDALAIIYTNSGNVDVYGGTFCPRQGIPTANAEDKQGNRVSVVFHEGVLFASDDIQRGDGTRIKLEEGCTKEAVEIDGKTYYQIVKGVGVSSVEGFKEALQTEGANIVLQNDLVLTEALTVDKPLNLNLNKCTLTVNAMVVTNKATINNGTIASGANANMMPQILFTGGPLEMNNVTVDTNHYLNANANWSEAVGMAVQNTTAVLNDCDIKINNQKKANWVFAYAIDLANAELTVNGGSITAICVEGNVAPNRGPTNPIAISTYGNSTATLNNVEVNADYYGSAVNGCLTINTTEKNIPNTAFANNKGGSYKLNYID